MGPEDYVEKKGYAIEKTCQNCIFKETIDSGCGEGCRFFSWENWSNDLNDLVGCRVKRGKDWKWGDQDHYGEGVILSLAYQKGWVRVRWDVHHAMSRAWSNCYRMGASNCWDLKLLEMPKKKPSKMDQLIESKKIEGIPQIGTTSEVTAVLTIDTLREALAFCDRGVGLGLLARGLDRSKKLLRGI